MLCFDIENPLQILVLWVTKLIEIIKINKKDIYTDIPIPIKKYISEYELFDELFDDLILKKSYKIEYIEDEVDENSDWGFYIPITP
jgi:hypothetical protein